MARPIPARSTSTKELPAICAASWKASASIDGSANNAELAALIDETQAAIVGADYTARREEDRSFDPQLTPDPREARAVMEDALVRAGRLRTTFTLLRGLLCPPNAQRTLARGVTRYRDVRRLASSIRNRSGALAKTLAAKLMLDLLMPNGRAMRFCTGLEMASFRRAFSRRPPPSRIR